MLENNQPTLRLSKLIAQTGYCSRRAAEELILSGIVKVNGRPHTDLAMPVPATAKIQIDGETITKPEKPLLFLYHKPAGVICTHKDERGRPSLFTDLKKRIPDLPRLMSVGRLDMNSEGLLLLTNDSRIVHHLESPKNHWKRRYKVRIFGTFYPRYKAQLEKGMTIEGISYDPIQVELPTQTGANTWVTLTLQEGKNREIRRIMKAFEIGISRLVRLSYGPFQLGSLPKHALKEVPHKVLMEQLGHILCA